MLWQAIVAAGPHWYQLLLGERPAGRAGRLPPRPRGSGARAPPATAVLLRRHPRLRAGRDPAQCRQRRARAGHFRPPARRRAVQHLPRVRRPGHPQGVPPPALRAQPRRGGDHGPRRRRLRHVAAPARVVAGRAASTWPSDSSSWPAAPRAGPWRSRRCATSTTASRAPRRGRRRLRRRGRAPGAGDGGDAPGPAPKHSARRRHPKRPTPGHSWSTASCPAWRPPPSWPESTWRATALAGSQSSPGA